MDYSHSRALEQVVISTAREHGFDGQPFAERPLPLGSRDEEMAAVWLSINIRPRPQTVEARRLAREWTRNIVLSSGRQTAETTQPTPNKKVRAW